MGSLLLIVPLFAIAAAAIVVGFALYGVALGLGRMAHVIHSCWLCFWGVESNGSDHLGGGHEGVKLA